MNSIRRSIRRPRGAALLPALLGALASQPARAQVTDPSLVGQFAAPISLDTIPIHVSVLPSGKVLFWGRNGGATAMTWDPVSDAYQSVPLGTTDLFCAGHAFLPNGDLLAVGGVQLNASGGEMDGYGAIQTNIFSSRYNTWTPKANMNSARWYPTACTLGNGEVVVVAGTISPSGGTNQLPQVWQVGGGWRNLKNAKLLLSTYPFLHLAPNGKIFNSGPDIITRYLDTSGNGSWSVVDDHQAIGIYRDYGSSVLYDTGKVLLVGGHDPPTATAEVIDLTQQAPRWRAVAPMLYARRHLNATLLPDGKVFVNGGTGGGGFNDPCGANAPKTAEMWDPQTETFTEMARADEIRIYHSVAALLPDGRVLTGGGGGPPGSNPTCAPDSDHHNVELYSPPYLFRGARPVIQSAPSSVSYGQTFQVSTPDASSIARVTWIRLSSTTHAFNENQRINRLSFGQTSSGAVSVVAPGDPNLCPPGHYMLFLLNASGVPSVAKVISIS